MKRAFSLLELTIVIVILGIVATMSFNLIFVLYKNYFTTQTIAKLENSADLALLYIDKLLSHRIKQSVIAQNSPHDTLEFVAYAVEAFDLGLYSGIADLDVSNARELVSPGSKFSELNSMVSEILQYENPKFNSDNYELAVVFKDIDYSAASSFGYNGSNIDIARAHVKNDTVLELHPSFASKRASEHYHIAYSAYAIIPKYNSDGQNSDFDLILAYDYRPWLGERYSDPQTKRALLARNVSSFHFGIDNEMVLLKICVRESANDKFSLAKSTNFDPVVCKTKAIY